jgi:hypothetical protein
MTLSRGAVGLSLSVALVVLMVLPATAAAYEQYYCGRVLSPGTEICDSSGLHSIDFNQAWYPGPTEHNVYVCEYVWNARTLQIRINPNTGSRSAYCRKDQAATYYGVTSQADYNGKVYNDRRTCCRHTINGYLSA